MDTFNDRALKVLLDNNSSPCVSLFTPTTPGGAKADTIHWKNLQRQAGAQLAAQGLSADEIRDVLRPAVAVLDDEQFWRFQTLGLAWFIAPGLTKHYCLPVPFPELAVTADRFHIKPMIRLIADSTYFVLAISQANVRLFKGSPFGMGEVDIRGVPRSLAEALGFEGERKKLGIHAPPVTGKRGGWSAANFHGQGVDINDRKDEALRFFQAVNHGLKDYLRGQDAPLVLAAVEYLWPIYRQANTYSHLLTEGVAGSPDHLAPQQIHAKAWPLIKHIVEAKERGAAELYRQLAGTGRTCHELNEVVNAAFRGKLEALWVASDRDCWGRWESVTATAFPHATRETRDEDLLNFAAWHTQRHGGKVFVLPSQDVPGGDIAAGIYWLPSRR